MEKAYLPLLAGVLAGWLALAPPSDAQPYASGLQTAGTSQAQPARMGLNFNTTSSLVLGARTLGNEHFGTRLPAQAFARARQSRTQAPQFRLPSQAIDIWGDVLVADSWSTSNTPYGYYSFSTGGSTELTELGLGEYLQYNGGGAVYDGKTHGICYATQGGATYAVYVEYDTDTWEATQRTGEAITDQTMIATSVAYDPVSKKCYGQFYNENQTAYEFGTIDYDQLQRTSTLSTQSEPWFAMAVTSKGTVYAIDAKGNLITVDKTTGTVTTVGATGVKPGNWQQGMAVDPKTDALYWAAGDADDYSTKLYEVDAETGKATFVCNVPDNAQLTSMYVPYYYAPGSPQALSLFTFSFDNGSTTGTIDFRMPKRAQDGSSLSGDLTYTIFANGTQVATGKGQPDEAVKAPVTLPSGDVKVGVQLSNAAGESPTTEITQWIGYDQPQSVQNVKLQINKETNQATLTWSAPDAAGSHDGYVDVDNLTYNVTRYPGGVKVAEDLKGTTFTEQLPQSDELVAYYYEVAAVNHGTAGEAVRSNKATVGSVASVPYTEDFKDAGSFNDFTVVDNNHDGATWWWSSGEQAARYETTDAAGTADDWLITPPIHLQKDCIYTYSFYVRQGSSYPERFAAGYGTDKDNPSAFTMTCEPTELTGVTVGKLVTKDITIDKTGNYYFGVQALSTQDGYFILVENVSVKLKTNLGAPAAVTGLTVTPDAKGARSAVISFTTPAKTQGGTDLKTLTKAEIYRGDDLIKTFDNPAPGTKLTYTDNEAKDGDNTYMVYTYNEAGQSQRAINTVYVGQDIPLSPKDLVLTDQLGGKGKLTWSSPGPEGEKGNPVNEDELVYNVYSVNDKGEPQLLKGDLKEKECEVDIPTSGKQKMVYFAVTAKNTVNESYPAVSNVVLGGTPYSLPFKESFAGGRLTSGLWTADRTGDNYFDPTQSTSSDGDGGAASFQAKKEGDAATLGSGKITLAGADNPWLVYRYYARPGKLAQLKLELSTNGDLEKLTELKTINYKSLTGEEGWRTVAIDLSPYKSASYIRLLFTATSEEKGVPVTIDDVNVRDALQHDLTARLTAPDRVDLGSSVKVNVEVQNLGLQPAKDYKVNLYVNGQIADTQNGPELASYELKTLTFSYSSAAVKGDAFKVKAEVAYDADEDKTNNTTTEATIKVRKPKLPIVTDLRTGAAPDGVALAWSKPELSPEKITDGFENYTSFLTQDFGDWQTANLDGQHTSGWMQSQFPNKGTAFGFIVFDPAQAGIDTGVYVNAAPYAGSKFAASMAPYEGWDYSVGDYGIAAPTEPADHWLISPLLNGKAQTATFYVKTFSITAEAGTAYYGLEPFEVWYSTTDTNPASFKQLGETGYAPLEWGQAKANLPEGAKYFAIRARAGLKRTNKGGADDETCYVFLVDNVSYQTGDFVVSHYNIFRDGKKIGQTNGAELSYTDTETTRAVNHVYNVSVVYTVGESTLSNDAKSGPTGINGVTSGAVEVEALTGAVAVSNAQGQPVEVYTLDGKRLYAETAISDKVTVALNSGVYLVKVSNKAVKVVVR